MGQIILAATRGLAEVLPVGRRVAGAAIAGAVDEGLGKIHRMPIDALPLGREQSRHAPEQVRGEVLDLNPR